MKKYLDGLKFGMLLQLAVGPMCLMVFNTAKNVGFLVAITLVLAIALVDAFYIILASLGVSKILDKPKIKKAFKIIGSLVLIIFGANINSVIVMGILISFIVTSIMITNSFYNTNKTMIKLFKTFKSNSFQLIYYLIFPYNINTIISAFKLGISMCLIGVISGEFLISKSGLGYLIIYGTQVFNMDLVFSGISLLLILSIILYEVVNFLDYLIIKKK